MGPWWVLVWVGPGGCVKWLMHGVHEFPVVPRCVCVCAQDEMRQLVRILVKVMPNSMDMLAVKDAQQATTAEGDKDGIGNKVSEVSCLPRATIRYINLAGY